MSIRENKESSDEEGNILLRGLSRVNREEDSTFNEPAAEATIIRKPQGSEEKRRVDTLNPHLGDLSYLINAYEASDFQGELKTTISTKPFKIAAVVSLDNDRIMGLVLDEKTINLTTYNPINGEIIHTRLLNSFENESPATMFRLRITPRRNILVTFHKLRTNYIYFCDQEGNTIWSRITKARKSTRFSPYLLDNDVVFLAEEGKLHFRTTVEEVIVNPGPGITEINSLSSFTPIYHYGNYFFYNRSYLCVYDSEFNERKVLKLENSNIIRSLIFINKNTILYGTENNTLIGYDIDKEKKVAQIAFVEENLFIVKVVMLTHNRCMLICLNKGVGPNYKYKFCDLGNLGPETESEFFFDTETEYIGNLSNGDVVIQKLIYDEEEEGEPESNLCIYNILKREMRGFHLDNITPNTELGNISSLDVIVAAEITRNKIFLWQ